MSVAIVGKDHPFQLYEGAEVDRFLAAIEGEERRGGTSAAAAEEAAAEGEEAAADDDQQPAGQPSDADADTMDTV